MRSLRISVVTVCYNSAATIAEALESVANQRWAETEHIVIDGGSTDGTLDVIESHRDKLAHVISEPDAGIYDAMNKGVARATGDVLAFLNSDDRYVGPDILADIAGYFASGSFDAVYGDVDFVRSGAPAKVVRRYSSARFSPARLADGWMMAHPALFLRKSVFDSVGPFRPDFRIAGDFEFIVRAFGNRQLRSLYVPRVLVRMRTGGASTAGPLSTIRLNREMLRACRENGVQTSLLRLLARYPRKALEFIHRG